LLRSIAIDFHFHCRRHFSLWPFFYLCFVLLL
jgi:hypothetical protein